MDLPLTLCRTCDVLLVPMPTACPCCGCPDPGARPTFEAVLVTPGRAAAVLAGLVPLLGGADRLLVVLLGGA